MNPAEQKAHRTVTHALEARIETLETVVDAMGRYLTQWQPFVDGKLELHGTSIEALIGRPTQTEKAEKAAIAESETVIAEIPETDAS